jgi:hypothetical protein
VYEAPRPFSKQSLYSAFAVIAPHLLLYHKPPTLVKWLADGAGSIDFPDTNGRIGAEAGGEMDPINVLTVRSFSVQIGLSHRP